MRKQCYVGLIVVAALVLVVQANVSAHHAFGTEFDAEAPIELNGKLIAFEWTNPHCWLTIEVKDPKTGALTQWRVEGGAPNNLLRRGWTRKMLPIGQEIHIEGFKAKDKNAKRANGHIMQIVQPDGKLQSFFMGSSGTGAPYEKGRTELDESGRPRQ